MPDVTPELIPGEMRLWTDTAPGAPRPAPRGPLLSALVRELVPGGRVLVAGPHSVEVVTAVAGTTDDLTVVVRSVSDAEELLGRHPQARVVCGDLAALLEREQTPYDVVLALDGAERVLSNDGPELSWQARLELLAGAVASSGSLVVSVDNPLSLLSFADARPQAERRDTGGWEPPAHVDHTRPSSLATATEALAGLGLAGPSYAAYPLVTAPTVLATTQENHQLPVGQDPRVTRSLRAGAGRALRGRQLLFDPTPDLVRAVTSGRNDLAPGWLFVLRREGGAPAMAEAYVEDNPGRPGSAVLALDGASARVLDAPADEISRADGRGEFERGAITTDLPSGSPLAGVLGDLALAEDLPALRREVAAYLTWARGLAETDPGAALLAVPAEVLVHEGAHALLDPTWRWTGTVTPDAGVARLGLATARLLLDRSQRRIWPPWMGAPELGRSLLATASLSVGPDAWETAAGLDAEVCGLEPMVVDGDVRSLRALNDQLTQEVVSARGQVFAHERLAANRDRQLEQRSTRLADTERRLAMTESAAALAAGEAQAVRDSSTFRLGRAIRHPSYGAKAAVRRIKPD